MRAIHVRCVIAITLALSASSAFAANQTIQVGRDSGGTEGLVFTPATVTIGPTDTVTFTQSATTIGHNVVADDNSFSSGAVAPGTWSLTVGPFAAGTTHPFFCSAHGGAGGIGMSGSIAVQTTPVTLQSFDVQ